MSVRLEVPAAVRELVERLEAAGFETWTVGGAVRDALRGRAGEREDWDLATRATPKQMRLVFRRTVPLGPRYGTLGIFGADGHLYEVTTFRHDVVTYGRRAEVAFAETLDEDLSRRDFTMNAIAWHPTRDVLHDPHGGRRDLQAGVLRAVGDPAARFREDYLRVLRGLRFAGSLGLDPEPGTWAGMTAAVPGLDHLSRERIREELVKVLAGAAPARTLRLYRRCGALQRVFGEMAPQAGRGAIATVEAVRGRRDRRGATGLGRVGSARLAALLLFGAGAGAGGAGTLAGGDAVTEGLARLRFSAEEAARVVAAMSGGLGPGAQLVGDAQARRRWVAATGGGGCGTRSGCGWRRCGREPRPATGRRWVA